MKNSNIYAITQSMHGVVADDIRVTVTTFTTFATVEICIGDNYTLTMFTTQDEVDGIVGNLAIAEHEMAKV